MASFKVPGFGVGVFRKNAMSGFRAFTHGYCKCHGWRSWQLILAAFGVQINIVMQPRLLAVFLFAWRTKQSIKGLLYRLSKNASQKMFGRIYRFLFQVRLTKNGFLDTCMECPRQADWKVFIGSTQKSALSVNLCNEHFVDFDTCNREYGGGIFPCRLTRPSRLQHSIYWLMHKTGVSYMVTRWRCRKPPPTSARFEHWREPVSSQKSAKANN